VEYLAVLLPSATLAVLFYFVMRSILNADRSEREAMTRAGELRRDEVRSGEPGVETEDPDDGPEIVTPNSGK
jgi:hypothetical protein